MGDANAAIPVLQKGATLDPDSKAIQQVRSHTVCANVCGIVSSFCYIFDWQLLSKCIMKSRRDARNEKDFYKKMLGQAQKIDAPKQTSLNDSGHEVPKVTKNTQTLVNTHNIEKSIQTPSLIYSLNCGASWWARFWLAWPASPSTDTNTFRQPNYIRARIFDFRRPFAAIASFKI